MIDIANLVNSLQLSVPADRRELEEAIEVIREIGGDAMYRRLIGGDSETSARAMGMVRTALACIINPARGSNAALEADIVGLAIGYPCLGGMSEVAKRHGLGRAAISKRVLRMTDELGLPTSPYAKDAAVRQTYRETNRRRRKTK